MQTPNKIYTGTVAEVSGHRDEIPADALLELKVFEHPEKIVPRSEWNGKSILEEFGDLIGTVHDGPDDMASHPEKYMSGFGQTVHRREL